MYPGLFIDLRRVLIAVRTASESVTSCCREYCPKVCLVAGSKRTVILDD